MGKRGRPRYPVTVCLATETRRIGAGGCYFCGGSGIGPHPRCPAGNNLTGVEPKPRKRSGDVQEAEKP